MIVKRLALPVAGGLLGLGLTACSAPLTHGTVMSKEYKPARTDLESSPVYGTRCTPEEKEVRVGKTTKVDEENECSRYVLRYHLVPVYTPECYRLDLSSGKRTGSVCVSEGEYDSARVGGHH